MQIKDFSLIFIVSSLYCVCRSDHECGSRIETTSQLIFNCTTTIGYEELLLYNYSTEQLDSITSLVVRGIDENSSGPFTSIPPNLCMLPNLQSIDFSNNRIIQVDPTGTISQCVSSVTTLTLNNNQISQFPSYTIYNMINVKNLYFRNNQLLDIPLNSFRNISDIEILDVSKNNLTTLELWVLQVKNLSNFTFNQIETITNQYFFNEFTPVNLENNHQILLDNNAMTINLTDAIYEMYNHCAEVQEWIIDPNGNPTSIPLLTSRLSFIDFGSVQVDCTCNQAFITTLLRDGSIINFNPSIRRLNCANLQNTLFIDFVCPSNDSTVVSSTDFSNVYPRQCKLYENSPGVVTNLTVVNPPKIDAPTYPYYQSQSMNPGRCFFAFSNFTTVRIRCTSDLDTESRIPDDLLKDNYFINVTRIDFARRISELPQYACALPSRQIDLTLQAFTSLNNTTFPCLDQFETVSLSFNQITSVTINNSNFTTLQSIDLSSNQLQSIPYSLLDRTPNSLRYVNLRNNSITSIDLFLYTLKNVTVDLRDNPINASSIINPLNVTVPSSANGSSSVNLTLPISVTDSIFIFNDQTALTAGACTRPTVLTLRDTLLLTSTVSLDCSCASINLKIIFLRNGSNITDDFTCVNGTTSKNLANLTIASCGTEALDFATGLCLNESYQQYSTYTSISYFSTTDQSDFTSVTQRIVNTSLLATITKLETENILTTEQTWSDHVATKTSAHLIFSTNTDVMATSMHQMSSVSDDIGTMISRDTTTTSTNVTLPFQNYTSLTDNLITEDPNLFTRDADNEISSSWTTTTTTTTTSTSVTTSTTTSATTSTTSTSTTTTTTTTTVTTSTTTSTTTTVTTSTTTSTTTTATTTTTSVTTTTSTSTSTTTTTSTSTTSTTTSQTTTTTTVTTSTLSTTSSTTTTEPFVSTSNTNEDRTSVIVGAVLGSVGFLALVGGTVAAVIVIKSKAAAGAASKTVARAAVTGHSFNSSGHRSLSQTRNLRSNRLAPITIETSSLPPVSFAKTSQASNFGNLKPSKSSNLSSRGRSSSKGIPLRLEPIRSEGNPPLQQGQNSVTINEFFNSNSAHNSRIPAVPPHHLLNSGGNLDFP